MTLADEGAPACAQIDAEGWVLAPGAVGWVQECDVTSDLSSFCSLASADYECEHGRLAGDECPSPVVTFSTGEVVQSWPHTYPCGCWPQEIPPTPTPDLIGVLSEQEKLVQSTPLIPASESATKPEAPFGYKTDGTPRKRPAPSPEQLAAATAGRKAAALRRETSEQAVEPPTSVESPYLTRMLADLDAEIIRLKLAHSKLMEALEA